MFYISQIEYSTDPNEQSARFVRGLYQGVRKAIQFWKLQFLPKHFWPGAVREYDYQNRTKEYMIRKARRKGHQRPLVWSGTLRQMVLAQFPQPRLSDANDKISGAMRLDVPAYTFYTRTKSGSASPPKYDELIRTNSAEVGAQQGILMTEVHNSLKRKMRKTVKTS